MNPVPGYTLTVPICETSDLPLYQAIRSQDGAPVLIKTALASRPAPLLLRRLEHEYEFARELDSDLIARPLTLEHYGDSMALVLEHGPDRTLAAQLGSPMDVSTFLHIAIGMTAALSELHRHELVHKDLKPEHVLLDAGGHVWLTGLGVASRLPRERQAPEPPEVIVGTLAYMAPEQTGRMNRSIDSRSDLYALGVSFHQMLTGMLPFTADDPMEWVHCHIARQPIPPSQRMPCIPEPLSAMVMKLLAKTAEDRYQSTAGLDADLRHCLAQWESTGHIEPFQIAAHDVPERLLIPEKLYGRQAEIDILLAAFKQVATSGTPKFMLVSGYSGVGKTAVVHELHKAMVSLRGFFAEGKFDQYKRDIPYATLVQALQTLVRQILGKSEDEVAVWRDAIQQAASPNAQLIVGLIPEVELIIGQQPPVPELPPHEAQNRFQRVVRRFLGVFATAEHPLTLFLDDLQWLDAATLELIGQLVTGQEVRHLLLIGAYRDNEVSPTHPMMRMLDALRKTDVAVQEIMLAPLTIDDMSSLVADTLHCDQEQALPLAQLVCERTGGNPFFAIQFLTALAEEKLLAFNPDEGRWVWDLARIHAKGYTDNVVDLMVGMLGRLPVETLEALKQFACLGNIADIATLTTVYGQSAEALHTALWQAVRAGLIFRYGDDYTFLHDRVQEAAYSLIPEGERSAIHLRIGRSLASGATPQEIEENIFGIVGQFNRATQLICSPEERELIAEFNLIAGRRAKASTAYISALKYLAAGQALLVADAWTRCYELSFALEILRAECEFLTGDLAVAEARMATLSTHAGNLVDSAAVTGLRVNLFTTMDRSDKSIEVTLEYLQHLGIHWSAHPSKEDAMQELRRLWQQLGSGSIEKLSELPSMSDPHWRATMDVLTTALNPALFTDQNLLGLMVGRMVNLSLEHGNSDGSPIGYAFLGMLLGPYFDDYPAGARFAQLAVDLVEKQGFDRFKARVYLHVANVVNPWMRHFDASTGLIRRAFATANETGDLSYASYSCNHLITNLLAIGDPLEDVQHEAEIGLDFVRNAQFGLVVDILVGQLRLIRALRGLQPGLSLNNEELDEERFERNLAEDPHLAIAECWYWIRKLQERFLAGDYPSAIRAGSKAERLLWTSPSHIELAEYHFYDALAQSALCDTTATVEQTPRLAALADHHRQLAEWAEHCPQNFANRALLVAAEIARIEGRVLDAETLYEQAIRSARENGFVHNEGIASEVTAKFYLKRGFETIARAYLREAHACYARWGAQGKVRQMERRYPQLRETPAAVPGATFSVVAQELDILAVARASQAISGEIVLDNLLKTLMRIVLENAGARQGYLLLIREKALTLAAEARVEQQNVVTQIHDAPRLPEALLPASILNYVRRSLDKVLLEDATGPNPYSADEYFSRQHPRSVLCFPIVRQTKLIGLLYLENDLATHAFTPQRLAILELLAAQTAISLENASGYEALQESEAKYRRIVDTANEGIMQIGPDGMTTFVNAKMAELTGYSPEEMIGKPPATTLFEEDMPDHVRRMANRRTGVAESYESRIRRKDGETVWVFASAAPIFDDEHRFQGSIAMVTDVTERRQAVEELRRYKDQLEDTVRSRTTELRLARDAADAANKAKSVFLANMSHELRTPLNAILGFSSLLRRDSQLTESQRNNLDIINRSGEHLLTLINDVLEIAKIEAGRLQLEITHFDLGNMVREVIDMMQIRAQEKSLTLLLDQSSEFPRYIQGDEARLRQILVNLLGNAVKFTVQGGVILRLGVKDNSHLHLLIEVEDTGPGISQENQQQIFQPFVQLVESGEQKGTGLGLTITRQFVQLMGGNISVSSTLGKGTRFQVDLPVDQTHIADIPQTEQKRRGEIIGLASDQPHYRILIAEDQQDNQLLLGSLMTNLGLEVKIAENGERCVQLYQEWHPDLIWMDRRMPVMDGVEATRRIRQLSGGGQVKIVAVTASAFKEQQQELLDAGMNGFVRKPYRFDEIYDALAQQLGIQYAYHATVAENASPTAVTPEMLAKLPASLRMELKTALEELDAERITEILRQVADLDADLGRTLSQLTEYFDYMPILNALGWRK